MPDVIAGDIEQSKSLEPVFAAFERDHAGFKIGCAHFEGDEGELTTEYGGVRYIWIDNGSGEVLLELGYRTQEGDGERLPTCYEADECDDKTWSTLETFADNLSTIHEQIRPSVETILNRISDRTLSGDVAGEIRSLVATGIPPVEWATRPKVRRAFDLLLEGFSIIGWSTKLITSFEKIEAGDQLIIEPDEPLHVRGNFRYWWIEDANSFMTHLTKTRRLRYLRNITHGRESQLDEFNRLPAAWHCNTEIENNSDGVNSVNSRVANIASDHSQPHYHPAAPIGGGKPQHELYFIMNPDVFALDSRGGKGHMRAFPDLQNPSRYEEFPLKPGNVVYVPPDTGHQVNDVFLNTVALPGFKPFNTIHLEQSV
ncbi:MAG: hypothetical protein OXN17_02005 [Candidatus Poribacteria bacterium]|nr:hypothetical protein [Candidatus Poribacteria bacterium]MDE0506503.1 hypothetical protein [Candidatus Poribacteria bacterium]